MNFSCRYRGSEQEFQENLQQKISYEEIFEDYQFEPKDSSIIDPDDIVDDLMDLGPVEWKRPCDIPGLLDRDGKTHIFQGKIEPNDIKQGQIGDCYFLSSIAALSEFEHRIRKIFITDEVNQVGCYASTMYKNGMKMIVEVDDLFPCKGDQVAFARSNGAELWVLLLEKMWAKLHGCYDRIAGGLEYETIRDLTGAPGYFFSGIDDDTFDRIYQFDQKNYVMGCSMSDQYDVASAEAQGIVPGHAYTLLSATTIKDKSGKDTKLVKLRNPWGSGEWNGKWSDKSSEWTPELRKQVGFDGDKDDGIFWMDFDDFKQIYGFWSVNKYMDDAKFSNAQVSKYFCSAEEFKGRYTTPNYSLFRFEVKKTGFYTFAVSQFGNRLLPRKADYKYANVISYLVKENSANNDSFKDCTLVEASITRQDRDTYLEVEELEAGVYWLYVDIEWQPSTFKCFKDIEKSEFSYTVNCYGLDEIDFGDNRKYQFEQIEILSQMLSAYCQYHHDQDDEIVKVDESQYAGIKIWEEYNYWESGYNFKLVHNTTPDQVMVLCHSHLDFKNGYIIAPSESSEIESYKVSRSQYAFSVPPNTKRGVFAKPYAGFGRGGQAHTPYVVDKSQLDNDILSYYKSHYSRYQLSSHNVVSIEEEKPDDSKLPDDLDEIEDESTAPAVKSGFKPGGQKELKNYKMLVLLSSEDDTNFISDVTQHADFVAKTKESSKLSPEMNLDVKMTTFKDFKDKKLEDVFDFVALVYLSSYNKLMVEEQYEYLNYYLQAPIVNLVLSKKVEKDEQNVRGATNYLMGKFKNKFNNKDTTTLPSKPSEAVKPFLMAVKSLSQAYEKKKQGDVKKAFDRFDKDGNGTIDLKELNDLSRSLGQPLTTQQSKDAFKDLDLDHNGSIDFEEFSRWYFTGLKPYNGSTRSMLQIATKTSSVFEAMKNKEITDILNKDQKLTKHRVCINLNSPPDGQRIFVKFNAFGPETQKLQKDAFEYKQQFLEKLDPKKQQLFGGYVRMKVNVKRTAQRKIKQAVKELQALFDSKKITDKEVFGKFNIVKDQLNLQVYFAMRERDWIPKDVIPESLMASLMNIDQGAQFKFTMGFSPQEVVDCKKSIAELVTEKGLKAELDIHFLKSIHKALMEAYKDQDDNPFKQGLAMAGPAFGLNTRLNLDLKFKDFEEIKNHPMSEYMVFTLSKIFEWTVDKDLKYLKEQKFDLNELDQAKIQELIDKEEITQNVVDECKQMNALITIMEELDPVTKSDIDVFLNDMFSVNGQIRGHGFGELIGSILRAVLFKDRKYNYKRVHKAYTKAYDQEKYKELYEEEDKKEQYDNHECMYAECGIECQNEYGINQDDMMMDKRSDYAMMECMDAPKEAEMEESMPLLMQEEEVAAPTAGKASQPKKVKSKFTAPSPAAQDDILGDSDQMKQIKAYIQEQVQLRVNAAIDQEAERQIDLQMREFKEQYLREAINRVPAVNGNNKESAQIGRIPANIVMGSQAQKKDPGSISSPRGADKTERSTRTSRKDRANAGIPSNTLRRAESKKANSPNKLRR